MAIFREPLTLMSFLSVEEHQLLVSLTQMGEEMAPIGQIEGLYHAAMSYGKTSADDMVIFQFLTFTHYHFLLAIASQMRCHLSEAFASVRSAIDATLNAAYIIQDRAAQIAYAKREWPFGGNLTRHLYKLLKEGKALPHPLMEKLLNQQSVISTFAVHADVGTFLHRVGRVTEGGVPMFSFGYFQYPEDPNERKLYTLTILHSFVMVLDVFSEFLINEQKVVPEKWVTQLHDLGARIERRADQLRDAVRAAAGVAPGDEPAAGVTDLQGG